DHHGKARAGRRPPRQADRADEGRAGAHRPAGRARPRLAAAPARHDHRAPRAGARTRAARVPAGRAGRAGRGGRRMILSILRIPLLLLVLLYQSVFLALSQIRTNKVRSLLTMVGIIIGVASVTAVIAALTGLKNSVLNEFESFGANKMFISVEVPEK